MFLSLHIAETILSKHSNLYVNLCVEYFRNLGFIVTTREHGYRILDSEEKEA